MKRAGQRVLFLLLLPLLLLSFAGHEAAAAGSGTGKIIMDSEELALPKGIRLENVNGSVMIPIRVVVENLGFEVLWEQQSRTVTVQQDGKKVQLAVGSKKAEADGVALDLNAAPKQTGGTVLVPIRFVSEQFGLKVGWDNTDKTVYISGGPNTMPSAAPEPTYSPSPASTPVPAASPTAASPDPAATPVPTAQSTPLPSAGSPQVLGAVFSENRLMIATSGGAAPSIQKLTGPDRIVVDFQGANFAADFAGTLPVLAVTGTPQGKLDVTGYPLVTEVRYAMFSVNPPTARFVIQTVGTQAYQVSTDAATGLVTIDLNAVPGSGAVIPGTDGLKPVVVLDAGHGGTDPGAGSITNKREKDFNLAVVKKLGDLLTQEGLIEVIYTRSADTTIGLKDRVKVAKDAGADLFISVHGNSLDEDYPNREKINGSETYYTRSASIPLAEVLHKHLLAATGFKDNGIRSKSLHVTRETTMPAVLLEVGYLTNPGNEAAMFSDVLQDNLARELAAGIKEYLGL
ncbi:N-acetylmuramoyl-L-alanine amidase family protein [Paenibacillus tengchongensis]|uniref:N-acetylmuramoyl-L-alanine amidase family protein n=1 Tax=Paenibacillus tengchongensis TaxID=2608684 RepID=UPI00124D1612|nr:N-acetylmuramoyl-L-alanine amidase family protein [Paenibacillus tengchongensis]